MLQIAPDPCRPGGMVRVSWRLSGDCVEIAVGDGGGPTAPVANQPAAGALELRDLLLGPPREADPHGRYVGADRAAEMAIKDVRSATRCCARASQIAERCGWLG